MKFLRLDISTSQDLSAGVLNFTTTTLKPFKLEQVVIRASVNITEDITLTLDSGKGSNYDTILRKKSLSSEQNFIYKPDGEMNFLATDELNVQITNANTTGVVYVLIKTSEI